MTARRRALATLLAALVLGTPAAHAGNPVLVRAFVYIESWTGPVAKVCAFGDVDDGAIFGGEWRFVIAGARSDGSVIDPPAATASGDYMPLTCINVSTNSTDYGTLAGQLLFAGPNITDVTGAAGIVVDWEVPIDGAPHHETRYDFSEF